MNFTLLDGGMGRELLRIGAPFKQPEWSALALIEAPHWVTQAHRNFLEAGADIITSNSYACVPFHLGEERFVKQGAELVALAARLAHEAAAAYPNRRVAASMPPVAGSYRPDLFNVQQASAVWQMFIEQQQAYADLWLGETMSSSAEAALLLQLLANQTKPIWISFTLDDSALDTPTLRSGEKLTEALEQLNLKQVEAILFNCSIPEVMQSAVQTLKQWLEAQSLTIKIGVYANGFSPQANKGAANEGLSELRDLSEDEYRTYAETWRQAGAEIIGGCCGITPQHIARLNQLRQ
ncbi:homocysteine S-methyltransferase [Pasteurella testudinis DSM 23072]|uniref:Homocysteine S-methyltransferase n=1 Tax=Pasteurella testudinis DSM 23072 TaxID=1122938 RepID=A0A1W1UG36_9PAST|nr:homocysteine S-methyltransferase family protein [Pasteurella testudinis]SMB80030.1 homocysteine S-methyltransferase [Pasteurella testudinis DSM 23072]SUB50613.1 Homocysteine S-methyltransferase [Pasteurella testudinis]